MSRTALLVLAIAFSALIAQGQTPRPCQPPAPLTVTREQNIFTEEQEADLGDAIAEHIQRNYRLLDDEEITDYLKRIGQRIVKHLPPSSLRFQFFLLDLPEANAFVLPGGRVYFSRKLVALAQSEDEIAGVIGHEIGHLLARQGSTRITREFREVLGVTEVKDRRDIFEKYNQLLDSTARNAKAFARDRGHVEKDQIVADQIGLFAVSSAGYDPQAHASLFDRITENKGNTGSFFSELFGTTKPEAKRMREMIKGAASLPSSCIDARAVAPLEEFQRWQASVIKYTGSGRRESLHSVVRKISLEPPLRGDVTHMRFSPDGKFVLAQDESGINVLTREPFALLFRIEAPEAKPAQFTPDSQDIVLYNSALRVEQWSVSAQKLIAAHELIKAEHNVMVTERGLFLRKGCIQSQLSPDGRIMACLDSELNLDLIDVASGAQVFQKKSFYEFDAREVLMMRLWKNAPDANDSANDDFEWINMGFTPDARYFAAGASSTVSNVRGSFSRETSALAVDLTTREQIPLRGPIKKLLSGGFAFLGSDRLVGLDRDNGTNSPVVSFPAGEILDRIPLGSGKLAAATRGNYLLIRPITGYKVGVMDLSTRKIFLANKQSAFDLFDDVFVSERINGELGLYAAAKQEMRAKVLLPRNPLGHLRGGALSPDMRWLAVSERSRGAVWDLTKGERVYHVRGFRGGYFGDDGALYADFPKFEQSERTVVRLDLIRQDVSAGSEIKAERATQFGPFVFILKPAKEGDYQHDSLLEVHDVRTFAPLWSKAFQKEVPGVWMSPEGQTLVLAWPVSTATAQSEIKSDSNLTRQLARMKEKEGDYFLQVVEARTGKATGGLLIETGKGSFRISGVFASGDSVVISDTENRTLIYSLQTGEQKGKVFGSKAAISSASRLLCVENESGKLILYDLGSMEERDRFTFSSPVSLARFSSDGKSLFVLTARQIVYQLDVSTLAR